ncbi:hypothetical protein GYMLUDRAFT_170730 [Collybiopsis luxurians FD-317 M1]|uniref:Unplaced genomic scaffold GYMLUscaffold_36, whole genome shotgun sequence n=1 Tax=Collybiopsis luxurians FD-317 M1 TaxID=944289 RepID=A0A0D0CJM1_9AGAR|nr:hypothetical protein GYMLUDRAFT_170730 [Collybiopsis luxurians FD-317 M1]
MPNPSESNGHQNGTCPSDEWLHELLHGYARNNLSLEDQLLYLQQKEKFNIGYVCILNFDVPTVQKLPSLPVATTNVSKAVSADTAAQNGPSTVQQMVCQADNVFIPQYVLVLPWLANKPANSRSQAGQPAGAHM